MMMKTLSFLFLLAASMSCFAQNTEPKNELGLNLYGLEIDVDFIGDGYYRDYYANGLQFKRLLNEHYKIRASAMYYEHAESGYFDLSGSPDGGSYTWSTTGKVFELRSGLERQFFTAKKISPFVFADIVYRQENRWMSTQYYSWMGRYVNDEHSSTAFIGAMCGVGVMYKPAQNIYIGLESSIGRNWAFNSSVNNRGITLFSPIKILTIGLRF